MTDAEKQILLNQVAIMALLTNMVGDNVSGTRDEILRNILQCADLTQMLVVDEDGNYPHFRC